MYNGIREVVVTDQELADFYEGKIRYDLLLNQYLLLKNEQGDYITDKYRWDGLKLCKVSFKTMKSQMLDDVKPRNAKQELYSDLLANKSVLVKCICGEQGTGKSYLSTAWALQEIQKGNSQKFVVIKNNVLVENVPDIGSVPGSEFDKLRQHCGFITDITGNILFEHMVQKEQLELAFLGTLRGRSLSNSIILVSEAQNLTTKLVRMVLARVGENSTIIWDFDIEQIDKKSFEKDNGMLSMIEALKGHKLFGIVELDLIERSDVARLASLF